MARGSRNIPATVFLAAAIAGAAWMGQRLSLAQAPSGNDVATITGFSIPEVDDKGELLWKVLGAYAKFNPNGGPVDITRARVEMYKDSKVDMVLTTPQCLYDREKREAETEAPVRITGKNLLITGNGFYWSGTNFLLVIRRDARVEVSNAKTFVQPTTNTVTTTQPSPETQP